MRPRAEDTCSSQEGQVSRVALSHSEVAEAQWPGVSSGSWTLPHGSRAGLSIRSLLVAKRRSLKVGSGSCEIWGVGAFACIVKEFWGPVQGGGDGRCCPRLCCQRHICPRLASRVGTPGRASCLLVSVRLLWGPQVTLGPLSLPGLLSIHLSVHLSIQDTCCCAPVMEPCGLPSGTLTCLGLQKGQLLSKASMNQSSQGGRSLSRLVPSSGCLPLRTPPTSCPWSTPHSPPPVGQGQRARAWMPWSWRESPQLAVVVWAAKR